MTESNAAIDGGQELLSTTEDGAVEILEESIPKEASAGVQKEELTSVPHSEIPIQPGSHPAPESEAPKGAEEPILASGEPIHPLNETKEIVSEDVEGTREPDHTPAPHQDVDQTLPSAPAFEVPEGVIETDHTPLPHPNVGRPLPPAPAFEAPENAMETDVTVTPHPDVDQPIPPAPAFEASEFAKEELAPPSSDVIMAEAGVAENQERRLSDERLETDQNSLASVDVGSSSVALSVCHS
jgi:hypothetical protein